MTTVRTSRNLRPLAFLVVIAAAGLVGCDDFATPAQLEVPQVLNVTADPPVVEPGEQTVLSVLVAGPDGEIADADVTWAVVPTVPNTPPTGTVVEEADGSARYTAPAEVAETPAIGTVQATVTVGDRTMVALKGVVIGDLPLANPTITALMSDDSDVLAGGELVLATGATAALAIELDPPPGEDATFAWYATIGEIERYQSSPTEIVAPEEAGEGWLFVVARDGRGGSAVAKVAIRVEAE